MVLVEHLRGVVEVEVVVRSGVPGQFRDPLQVGPDHLGFHRLATGPLQAAQLALDLGPRFRGKFEGGKLGAEILGLARLVVVAQFLLDRLHLLAEVHLLLALAQLGLDLRLDLVLRLEHADLALDQDQDAAEPVLDAEGLQEVLLLLERQLDVAGDEVGEPGGVGHGVHDLVEDFLGKPPALAEFHGPFADLAIQRREGRVLRVDRLHLRERRCGRLQEAFGRVILERMGTLLALEEQLDAAQPPLELADPRNDADRVELLRRRLLRQVALGDGEDEAVALDGRLDRPQGPRPTDRDRQGQAGEDHRPSHGEDG